MITVILYGEKNEKNLTRIFERNLKRYYQVHAVAETGVKTEGRGRELLLFNTENLSQVNGGTSILVLKPSADLAGLSSVSGNVIALANSNCPEQLAKLAEKKIRTVVCGLSSKDTVTFSSFNDSRAAVSLQRTVETPDGRVVEPMEVMLELEFSYDPLSVLFYTAVMMICGGFAQEKQGKKTINFLS